MKLYDIPINQIITTLKSYNCEVNILQVEDHPIEFTKIQNLIAKPELEKAIIEIYNHGLISLYLTNMKGLSSLQTKKGI